MTVWEDQSSRLSLATMDDPNSLDVFFCEIYLIESEDQRNRSKEKWMQCISIDEASDDFAICENLSVELLLGVVMSK